MAINDPLDDIEQFEAKETSHRLPAGWLVLFFGLIAFGVFYLWAYTPSLGGWSQSQDLDGSATSGSSLFATILFTAVPTAVAVVLILAQRKKK